MLNFLLSLRSDERGVSSIEYAILAVGVALAILAGAQFLSGDINAAFTSIGGTLLADI